VFCLTSSSQFNGLPELLSRVVRADVQPTSEVRTLVTTFISAFRDCYIGFLKMVSPPWVPLSDRFFGFWPRHRQIHTWLVKRLHLSPCEWLFYSEWLAPSILLFSNRFEAQRLITVAQPVFSLYSSPLLLGHLTPPFSNFCLFLFSALSPQTGERSLTVFFCCSFTSGYGT